MMRLFGLILLCALAGCASVPAQQQGVSLTVAGPPIAAEKTDRPSLYQPVITAEGSDGGIAAQPASMLGREDRATLSRDYLAKPYKALAWPVGEPFDAVPLDRVYAEPGENIRLSLPPGRYAVRAVKLKED